MLGSAPFSADKHEASLQIHHTVSSSVKFSNTPQKQSLKPDNKFQGKVDSLNRVDFVLKNN